MLKKDPSEDGDLTGTINHITPSQDILGIPLTFVFSGENMKRFKAISVDGTLDHVAPARSRDLVNSAVKGYKVENLTLSDKAGLPVMLTRAVADLNVRALLSGDTISANLTVDLSSVQLTRDSQEGAGPVAKAISSALSDISRFRVNADITGTLEDYDIRLSSDLDRVLREAASKMFQQQAAQLKSELKDAIFAKVDGPLKQAKTSLGGFDVIGNELTNRVNLGSRLVKGVRVPF